MRQGNLLFNWGLLRQRAARNDMICTEIMPLITLFSAPKPFTDPHIAMTQRNAVKSWTLLPDVEVILLGEETGLAAAARELDVKHISNVERNENGTPLSRDLLTNPFPSGVAAPPGAAGGRPARLPGGGEIRLHRHLGAGRRRRSSGPPQLHRGTGGDRECRVAEARSGSGW